MGNYSWAGPVGQTVSLRYGTRYSRIFFVIFTPASDRYAVTVIGIDHLQR